MNGVYIDIPMAEVKRIINRIPDELQAQFHPHRAGVMAFYTKDLIAIFPDCEEIRYTDDYVSLDWIVIEVYESEKEVKADG